MERDAPRSLIRYYASEAYTELLEYVWLRPEKADQYRFYINHLIDLVERLEEEEREETFDPAA
jgi:hypothetical protein